MSRHGTAAPTARMLTASTAASASQLTSASPVARAQVDGGMRSAPNRSAQARRASIGSVAGHRSRRAPSLSACVRYVLQGGPQPRPPRGDPDQRRHDDGQRDAGNGDHQGQRAAGREAAADQQEHPGDGGDHPARQQRPAGEQGAGAEPGEAAEEVGGGQPGAGQRNGNRHRVGRVDRGEHRSSGGPDATTGEQQAEHRGERGHRRRLEQDADREQGPVQTGQHRERSGQPGPLGRRRPRHDRDGDDRDASRHRPPGPCRATDQVALDHRRCPFLVSFG